MKNNIFKIMATVASVCVAGVMVAFACSKTSLANDVASIVDNKTIQSNTDEFAGVYITAGTEQVNKTQEKIRKAGKIYSTKNENEDNVFEGLDGAFTIQEGIIDEEELSYTFGEYSDICESNVFSNEEYDEEGNVISAVLSGEVTLDINASLGKDVYCYINPIYREAGTGKYYVTTKGCEKAIGKMRDYQKRDELNLEQAKEKFKTEWNEDPVLLAELDPIIYEGCTSYAFYQDNFKSDEFNANKDTSVVVDLDVIISFEQPVVSVEGIAYNNKDQEIGKYNMSIEDMLNGKTVDMDGAVYLKEIATYGDGSKSTFIEMDGTQTQYYEVFLDEGSGMFYDYMESKDDIFIKSRLMDVVRGVSMY